MAKTIYDIIKKQNGEGFARVLRDRGLLDIPDIANIVKYAGHTAADAKGLFTYLWSLKKFKETDAPTNEDPFKLLDQAGYHAFEAHNLDEQNSIRRFFRNDEELCTFRDDTRYQNYYIIHAIKHDVWRDPHAIKPSTRPQRQDEYGTSVISIQIAKDGGFISIKNRYNHNVDHPDQTFNSNPDEIISGLSAALKGYFNVDWKSTGDLPPGFIDLYGQVIKTEFEIMNNYVGDGFYTDHGDIINIDKRSQIQMDYFVWDNQKKQLLNPMGISDCFLDIFNKFVQGKQVTISGKSPNQTFIVDGIEAVKLENNQIVSLNLPGVTEIGDDFLGLNKSLRHLSLPDAETIGYNFLRNNTTLESAFFPRVRSVCDYFMYRNDQMREISMPMVETIADLFMYHNTVANNVSMPNVRKIGLDFMYENRCLRELDMQNVTEIGDNFMFQNEIMERLSMPNATDIGINFLYKNKKLKSKLPQRIITAFRNAVNQIRTTTRPNNHTNDDREL